MNFGPKIINNLSVKTTKIHRKVTCFIFFIWELCFYNYTLHVIRCSFNSGNQRQHNDDRTHVSTLNLHIQGIGEDCLETAVGLFPQTSFVSFPGNIMIYVYFCLCISLHLTFLHNKCSMFRLQYDRRTFQVIVKAEFGHVHLVYIIFWL